MKERAQCYKINVILKAYQNNVAINNMCKLNCKNISKS